MIREKREAVQAFVENRLRNGDIITIDDLLKVVELDIPEEAARMLWLRTYLRGVVHRKSAKLGVESMSVKGGFKRITSPEEAAEAQRRVNARLNGEIDRNRRLQARQDRLEALHLSLGHFQAKLNLKEAKPDAADGTPERPAAASM